MTAFMLWLLCSGLWGFMAGYAIFTRCGRTGPANCRIAVLLLVSASLLVWTMFHIRMF
jgi:hypothetical protein